MIQRYTTDTNGYYSDPAAALKSRQAELFPAASSTPAAPTPTDVPQAPAPTATLPAATSAPAFTYSSDPTIENYYKNLNTTVPGDQDVTTTKDKIRQQMQDQIDAINGHYNSLVSQQQKTNKGYSGSTRAINARSGLLGSDFGDANARNQDTANKKTIDAIEAERSVDIAGVNSQIDSIARAEIQTKKQEALGNQEKQIQFLQDNQQKATQLAQQLAQGGTDLSKLDPARRSVILKNLGNGDESMGELVYNGLKPKASQIDYKAINDGGKILLYGVDPITGQLKEQRVDLTVPDGYQPAYVDGKLYYKGQDGTLTPAPVDMKQYPASYQEYLLAQKEGFKGNYNDYQTADANRKRSITNINSGGLSPYQQFQATQDLNKTLVRTSQGARDASRYYDLMKQAYDRLDSGQAKDMNATTQAIIQSFNKITDPNSVVRESEYARSPEGQGLIQTLEGKANAITQGGPGLTKQSLKEFVDLAGTFAQNAQRSIDAQNAQAAATAKAFGLNPDLVGTPSYGAAPSSTQGMDESSKINYYLNYGN